MKLSALIYVDEDGLLCGSVPQLPGCHSQGATREDLLENLRDAASLWFETQREKALQKAVDSAMEETVLAI